MRLLIVEDDATIADFVAKGLAEAGFAVDVAADGAQGLELAAGGAYDVAIVDIMLPQLDGLTLIDRMRARGVRTPVLILSARRTRRRPRARPPGRRRRLPHQAVCVRGAAGARPGPHPPLDRRRRTHATHRRRPHARPADAARRAAGQALDLRPREFALLEYLMRNPGRVLSKTMILSHVWGYNFNPGTNVVDVLVSRLREKIDKDFDPKLLHTVRGVGYVLEPRA